LPAPLLMEMPPVVPALIEIERAAAAQSEIATFVTA